MEPAAGQDDGVVNHDVVFLDTSLDTHLAMIVSDTDTVSDFKRKLMLEHRQLFPAVGDIKVECLKIKRRGSFYHLADSMLVKSALGAAKGSCFVSVDASRLEQNDGIRHMGNHMAGDQLALPWTAHSRSIDRHENHGSPSVRSIIAPLVNEKVLNVDQLTSGDSCKDVSKNVEEDRLCNAKQLEYELQQKLDTVNTDMNSKKRTRDNESSLKDTSGSGPSVKKKRKTQRGKGDVKALEESLALTHDNVKVKNDKGASINNENTSEHKAEGNDLRDEDNRTNKGENCSALDKVGTIITPSTEGVGSETAGDVAMVVENNIQQEISIGMSQKEKDNERIKKPAMEDEIHSSLMSTPDCEHDAAGVPAAGHMKRSTKHKAAGSGPSVKKKRKTQRRKGDVKALEENLALTHANVKVNDMGASINNENASEHKAEGNVLRDEDNRINKGENCSALDKVDTIISPSIEGSETVGDVAMVVENNIQQEMSIGMSQKEKDIVIQKPAMEDEIHTSLMSTPDCEHVAAGVPAAGHMKRSTKHKATEKEVSSTKDATESSPQQDIASNSQECAGDQSDKYKEDTEIPLKQKPELRLPARKKGAMGSENIGEGKRRKTKKLFKHADNLVGDISSTVLASVIEERKIDEVPDKTLIDCNKGGDVIMKEMEISVENSEEKSRKEFTDTNDVVSVTNEDNLLPHSESLMNNDADIPATGKHTSQVNAQGVLDNLEKQNEKTDDTTKKKKKRKTKKSAGRNEGESITKHVDGDICENDDGKDVDKVKEKDAQISLIVASVIDERKTDEVSDKTLIDCNKGDDVIMKEMEISVENTEEKSRKEFTDTNDVVSVTNEENLLPHSESLMNNDADIPATGKHTSQVNAQGILDNLEKQSEKTDDTTKKKKKRKTKKSAGRNEGEQITKHVDGDICENDEGKDGDKVKEKGAQISYEGLVGKADKNTEPQDLASKHQSTEVELGSKNADHHHLPEKTSKNVTASEVSKEVDILEDGSHELDSMDYFAPSPQPKKIAPIDSRKDMKKAKVDSRNDQSQKLVSKNENNKVSVDVFKDPNTLNIDKIKTPKRIKKIDAQKTNKPQTRVKTVEKKRVNSSQQVKSLLNTPGTIFGGDSDDDATVNSDSSTQAPSRKSSSSSSSSGETSVSLYLRRSHARKGKEGTEKNNQSKLKNASIGNLLRSSSAFKKAKVTASSQVEDTESQPVDFVPDSQL